jgi:hypothetical protein
MVKEFEKIISRYVPEKAIGYCTHLWDQYRFNFKVSRTRRSKLGDYKFNPADKNHYITVNGSLNEYAFLITYIHEVAHLVHHVQKGRNNPPHGPAWKSAFRELMSPMLNIEIFPVDIYKVLAKHMLNPKASSQSDIKLVRVLAAYDKKALGTLTLDKISSGELFELNNKVFKKIEKKRTRSVCIELNSGKRYLVSEMAPVRKCS